MANNFPLSPAGFEALNWLLENTIYLRLAQEHRHAHVVVYRDLYNNATAITQSIFKSLDWEVNRQTERFLRQTTAASTRLLSFLTANHAYYSVYRPVKHTLNSWKSQLSRDEQDEIIAIARPLLEKYWPVTIGATPEE